MSLIAPNAWDRPPLREEEPRPESRPAFGAERHASHSRRGTGLLIALLVSVGVHMAIVGTMIVTSIIQKLTEPEKKEPVVELVDASALKYVRALPTLDLGPAPNPDLSRSKAQIVDLPAPDSKEKAPKDARYLAEHDHKVKEETAAKETALTPKVLTKDFKGMGEDAKKGEVQEEEVARAETVSTPKPASEKRIDEMLVVDPFGIKQRPLAAQPLSTPEPESGERTTNMGSGSKVAMAGAPNNDYLPGVKSSDATQLNAKEFRFASFWNRVQRQVEPFWVSNVRALAPGGLQKRDYMTRVNVVLSPGGAVVAVEITQSCGIPGWDRAVAEAFSEASPFMNPPPQLVEGDGKIHMDDLGFIVSLTGGNLVHMYGDPRAGKLFPGVREGYGPR